MESTPFLTINKQTISLSQAIRYLKASGKFAVFISEILRQYILEHELDELEAIDIDPAELDQTILNFRLNNQLLDQNTFQNWLLKNGISYADFRQGITNDLKLEQLKVKISQPKLQEYFKTQKQFFDRVVLSRIIVNDKVLAEKLKEELLADPRKFEALAREYSITNDRIVNGMMGPVSWGTLPDILKNQIELTPVGKIIGPLEIDGNYGLFRVEQFVEASLDDPKIKQELQNQLFEQWLQKKLQNLEIKLEIKT